MSDMVPEVYTKYKRPKADPEVNSGEQITEMAGYIPADVQIEDMLAAGMRLGEYRREMYDFSADEEVPDDYMDVTRTPGIDVVDVENAGVSINAKIAEAKALLEKAAMEAAAVVEPEKA